MLVGDAPGPISGEVVLERLRLPDAFVAVALDLDQQGVDAFRDLAVLCSPPKVVLQAFSSRRAARQSVSTGSWAPPPPASRRSIASSRRRALAGERIRYAVSRRDSSSSSVVTAA